MQSHLPPTSPSAPVATSAQARRELVADFVRAGELERRRVAEAIHDDPIQVIAALSMRLQLLRRTLSDPDQVGVLAEAELTAQLAIARLRSLVFELQPPGLAGEGVSVALAMALEAAAREGGIAYWLDDQMTTPPAEEEGAILFRIAQEALANVREHADASSVTVTLLERDGGHAVRIADNGRGCDADLIASGPGGYGFASMRARVGLAGGSLSIDAAPDGGLIVEAWLPSVPDCVA